MKSFIDSLIDHTYVLHNDCTKLREYQEAKKDEICDLSLVVMEGPYSGQNIQDIIDINPDYLLWYHREGVLKLSPGILGKIFNIL